MRLKFPEIKIDDNTHVVASVYVISQPGGIEAELDRVEVIQQIGRRKPKVIHEYDRISRNRGNMNLATATTYIPEEDRLAMQELIAQKLVFNF